MIINSKIRKNLFTLGIAGAALGFVACSSEDDPTPTPDPTESEEMFFISVDGESAEYIITTPTLDQDLTLAGAGTELEQSGYRWIFNEDPSVAVGLIYAQGDPGIGLGYQLDSDGALNRVGQFQITSRFTSYGFFDNYAITSVGGQTPVDENGNALIDENGLERSDAVTFNIVDYTSGLALDTKTILTKDVIVSGQQATFSGIVDFGNGEFLTGVVASNPKDPEQGGGSSTGEIIYPDSCWVAALDADMNITRVYRSNKLSYSSGRFRSQYYSQISKDDQGNAYVFSGAYDENTTKPAGALRINSGAEDFDANYFFNIEEKSDGFKFRNVWHITEDYFLLEFYNELEGSSSTGATQYGIVKMEDQTFNWVGGEFPAKESIVDTGLPMAYDGKLYFPVTVDGELPALYIIDPTTAEGTKGISIDANAVNSIGVLRNDQ
ncbi:DUF4374 domain-containing protein [Echinicola rosea]|uniref:DUF4374 domain-containing protein n=1 Tax=Echinicola rosea TaxID=1807691 RepID=A0ABQ1VAV5_9BACT|nr:DUF4374 domain-containing protein [Echinicola rosea]GGF50074.1 hypothetical protein GCM10011339_43280 [Echinicola rosea]